MGKVNYHRMLVKISFYQFSEYQMEMNAIFNHDFIFYNFLGVE